MVKEYGDIPTEAERVIFFLAPPAASGARCCSGCSPWD